LIDPDAQELCALRFLVGDVVDGNGELVYRHVAAVRLSGGGAPPARSRYQSLYDLALPQAQVVIPELGLVEDDATVTWARQQIFEPLYLTAKAEREAVADIQLDFLQRSFNSLLAAADQTVIAAEEEVERGVIGAEGRLRKAEVAKHVQVLRRDERVSAAARGRTARRGAVTVLGSVLVLPPAGTPPDGRRRASNEEVEAIAVRVAREHEERRGAAVTSVEGENVGFDLLSTLELERRCIEVKGRAAVGSIELTWGEYAKATELAGDYWLYVVHDCASPAPRLYRVQDPVRALAGSWQPSLDVRFGVEAVPIIDAAQEVSA
jgi:hypothetical protein